MKPKTKKEIIEAAQQIIECYCQDDETSTVPFYNLSNGDKLLDSEIKKRWDNLLQAIGAKEIES